VAKIKQKPQGDVMVLALTGKIMGGPDYDKFHGEVKDLIAAGTRKFVLDFSGVDWINSTGIGILVGTFHSIKAADGRMAICSPNDRVLSIYYVSQLDKIFEVFASCEEAVASF